MKFISNDEKSIKRSKKVFSIIMIFLMMSSLVPQKANAVLVCEADVNAKLSEQREEFDRQRDEEKERENEVEETEKEDEMKVLREPDMGEGKEEIDGVIVDHDETSTTYKVSDNSYITRICEEPVFYKNENGKEKLINNELKDDGDSYTNRANSYDLNLPKEGEGIDIEQDERKLSLKPTFGELKDAVTKEDTIRYNSVTDGIDLQYKALGGAVKEDILLMHPVSLKEFKYELQIDSEDRETYIYEINDNVLSIYLKNFARKDGKGKQIYQMAAPVMSDAAGASSNAIKLECEEKKDGNVYVKIIPESEWVNAKERVYPIKIDPTIELSRSTLEWGFVASHETDDFEDGTIQHKGNSYLYVGYENGELVRTGNISYHQTRSYLKLKYDFTGLPNDAIITAKLRGYKYSGTDSSSAYVSAKMILEDWKGTSKTWNNMPIEYADLNNAQSVQHFDWVEWDISTAVREWADGKKNYGLMLTPKSEAQRACCFSGPGNEDGDKEMYLDIKWTVPNPVDENLPLNAPNINLRPYTYQKDGLLTFTGLTADGVVRPNLDVAYTLKTGKDEMIYSNIYKSAGYGRKYPDSNLVEDKLKFSTGYVRMFESNWQTEAIDTAYLSQVTPYKMMATAYGQAGTTPEGTSDEFIIYQFKQKDTLPYIAKYYGTKVSRLIEDNRPTDYLATVGSTYFIRNPSKNKTKRYVRDKNLPVGHKWELIYANLGRGKCTAFDLEPINTSNGNFYFEQEDATNREYTDDFALTRTYNSLGDISSGHFGYGWMFKL